MNKSESAQYSKGYAACLKRAERAEMELKRIKREVAEISHQHPRESTIEFCLKGAEALLAAASFLITNEIKPEEPAPPQTPQEE